MQTRVQQLDSIVSQFNLNAHPFYQAWNMGTLPTEKLALYASEYGDFVGTIDEGWDRIGKTHYAEEERVHEVLWASFRKALGAPVGRSLAQTDTLVRSAQNCFSNEAQAAGALYAFEAQQPTTSASKLEGLNKHYPVPEEAKEYFAVHAHDFAEAEDLRKLVESMTDEEFAQTKTACAVICAAMYGALDGVYYC